MTSAKDLNIDDLKGMPDVKFSFGVSAGLKSAFRAAAKLLDGQHGSRAQWRSHGSQDFSGYFSTVFTKNGTQQLADLTQIATALRSVATKVEGVEQEAREENNRRKTARDWANRQSHRSWLHKMKDDIFGGEDPPDVQINDKGSSTTVPAAQPKSRELPKTGSGGAGGTSSARPSNLESFVTSSQGADDAFSGTASGLQEHCHSFATACSWATLDASGPISALKDWLQLNSEDEKWASTVAKAFKAAGGDGAVSTLQNATIAAALKKAHVSVYRSDIMVAPAIAHGSPPTTGYSDDPINTATGNFIENEIDLGFAGASSDLALTRTYNSLASASGFRGAFGPGWASWSEAGLWFSDEDARVRLSDGREIIFPRLGDGWDRAAGENLWLSRREAAEDDRPGYRVSGATGLRWDFSNEGRLLSTGNGPGTTIGFGYDGDGRLTSMMHRFGRSVELSWDRQLDRVVAATTSDGRRADYTYDEQGRLTAVQTPAGTRTYRWNDAGLISAVVDADGVVEAENTYDESGRVLSQRSRYGRTTRYVYLPGGITSVSDEDGSRSNTWLCDSRGRLIGVIDADDMRQSTSYDRWGNPVMVAERNGAVTVTEYDDRGRPITRVTPSGARISWRYDDLGRPILVTVSNSDVEATTSYSYDGESRDPSRVIDPEGGVTLLEWSDGLLTKITDPVGVTVRFSHDDHGDLIATTDADGNVARLERDDLGRVVAAITPLGRRTTYTYSGTGPLLSRQDPDGAIWRYEHTAGGRTSAVIDPTGARTEIEYDLSEHGTGEESRTTDPLGRTVSSTWDDLGNRSRAELPDGSSWDFGYDAMSRLRSMSDATDSSWQLDYDVQGFVNHTTDPTGVERVVQRNDQGLPTRAGDRQLQTTASYDALGRTVSETGPDGTASSYSYDLCGRLITHTDPTGATTRIERDAAGRPVAITHPMGTTYRYEYDACGRRVATIDTDGSRYEFGYDGDGRLIREYWPTGEQAWVSYDDCGRPIERFEPGSGTSRFSYDRAGRVIRTIDGWYGRRHFRYDAAGQLVGVTNAAGGETRFEYDELGRPVATVDPLGGRSTRTFDPMGRVLSETDPLGRTTRYGYDAAGRQTRRIDPTGAELSWTYDDTGRLTDTLAGDRLLSTVERDFAARTMRVREGDTVNELRLDENGRLIRRTRGEGRNAIGLGWSYDGDGRRTAFTRTDGTQTRYEYDLAGRVSAVDEPGLGRAVIDRDWIGRIVSMTADGLHATWTWEGGSVVRHQVTRQGVTRTTGIERDDAGRVIAQAVNDVRTAYSYDQTGQLIEARRSDGSVTAYSYDASGRLVRETTDGRSIDYSYDPAGQLLSRRTSAGVTSYGYDAGGRRILERGPESERRFGWDPRGYLSTITTITHQQDRIVARTQDAAGYAGDGAQSTQEFRVDALGELASIDGQPVAWDSASGLPLLAQVGDLSISSYGPLTALLPDAAGQAGSRDGEWLSPDWRPRSADADPWGVPTGVASAGLPSGVAIGGQGSLLVDGLAWMQARVYDSGSRGFLSTDPMLPLLGAGWAGNPYSFAGNDPLNQSDPWGLHPVNDKELQAYRDSNNGALSDAWHATTNWVKNNWEYIAAGALIVGGIAVMCTGIGGPIGAAMIGGALMSGGISAGTQKFQTGSVNWGKVGVDAAIGGIAGAAGGGAAVGALRAAGKAGLNCFGKSVLTGTVAGAADGGVNGGLSYVTSGQPLTVNGFIDATAGGAVSGGVTGGVAGGVMSKVGLGACFVAGTQVLMGDGSAKNIEDVRVGDEVTAADPETGETHARRVIDTYVHEGVETYQVETSAGTVTSTAEHPFYVVGKGWIPVRDLQPGDQLIDPKGSDVDVVAVVATGETATVYNFNVDELHTYHVQVGETWVRVHNTCDVDYGSLDVHGRPTGVRATLTSDDIGSGSSASRRIRPPGFEGGGAGHHRGHLLGNQLGGSGSEPRNLVTLHDYANTPTMRGFENHVRGAVESGQTVEYSSTPIYNGSDPIPRGVTLEAHGSGGFHLNVTVLNQGRP